MWGTVTRNVDGANTMPDAAEGIIAPTTRRTMRIGGARYQEYLRSQDWRAKRDKVMRRDRRRCASCGSGEGLHVHHLTYDRLGHENLADLTTLCDICHHLKHKTH